MKKEIIEISGEDVSLFAVKKRRRKSKKKFKGKISLSGLFERIGGKRTSSSFETAVLPLGTKHYIKRGELEIVVVEQPPQVRSLVCSENDRRYGLAFPYVIYFFVMRGGYFPDYTSRLFFLNKPFSSLEDELLMSNLTHVTIDVQGDKPKATMCLHGVSYRGSDSLEKKIKAGAEFYWNSTFSFDRWGNNFFQGFEAGRALDSRIDSLEAWEDASHLDPSFVLEIPWIKSGFKVKDVLQQLAGIHPEDKSSETAPENDYPAILADAFYRVKEVVE